MDTLWFILPISGAILGYCTNWIAIRMLFRPRYEARIFGRKLPFTPGLIPKEKPRLARNIGKSFASNVLTEEELVKAVSSPAVMDRISALFTEFTEELRAGTYDEKIDIFADAAAEKISGSLNDPENPVNAAISGIVGRARESGFFHKLAESLRANGQLLSEYTPEHLPEKMMSYLAAKIPEFVALLKVLPEKYPDVDEAIGNMVKKIAEDNLSPFLGMFIKSDQIYGKFKISAVAWLEDPVNTHFIAYKISAFADGILRKQIGEIVSMVPEDTMTQVIDKITDKAGRVNPAELLRRFLPEPASAIKSLIKSIVAALTAGLNGERAAKLHDFILNAIRFIAAKGGAMIISSVKFDELIENKINASSVENTEKMVISVVNKELRMITLLGGVLGFIIGFLPLLLRSVGL